MVEHLADLPLEPLAQNEPEMLGPDDFEPLDLREPRLDAESTQHLLPVRFVEWPVEPHLVFLFHLVARVREEIGQVAVIRDEQ